MPSLVLFLVAMASSCTDDEPEAARTTTTDPRAEFCDAYEDMLEAQEAWTIDYLNSLTPEEREANRAEQDAVAAPVRELMPEVFVEDWDSLLPVHDAIDDALEEIAPPEGTTEHLLREVRAQGFLSLTDYVMRDGLEVEGETWTFDRYVAIGSELDAQLAAYCAEPA